MGSLSDKWSDFGRSESLTQKIVDKVKPDVPLKNKIDVAQKNLQLQIVKLDGISQKIKQKNDYIFIRPHLWHSLEENKLVQILLLNRKIDDAE